MSGNFSEEHKKKPFRAFSNLAPMLVVLVTPPSGDSSEYRFLSGNANKLFFRSQLSLSTGSEPRLREI